MTDTWDAHVLSHGELTRLDERLWLVEGRLPRGNMPRNMLVYRLDSGGTLIHSAIALNAAGMQRLEGLGRPELMIVPNKFHRLDASVYKARYPGLQVLCPAAARTHIEQKVKADATCEETLPKHSIKCITFPGIKPGELGYEVALTKGRALFFADVMMNLPNLKGFDGWLFRTIGSTGFFGVTGIGRLLFLKNRADFKAWLEAQAARDDVQITCSGHGPAIVGNCKAMFRAAADRL